VTINGYITRTGDVNIDVNTFPENFVVNDTLMILGDLNIGQNGANLVIGPDAVLIVIGDFSTANNNVISNNGIFVVSGAMNFPGNDSQTYAGTGELFSGGTVSGNNAASTANNWNQLDDLYPPIYEFATCRTANINASCMLPIKLSYFLAEFQNDIVELRWATIMEACLHSRSMCFDISR
jgi:hypothetical protein